MTQLDQVSVITKANVYFDGKCVSHTVLTADGQRKTVGVILPSKLTFNTDAAEVMELIEGRCRVTLGGQTREYRGGEQFSVPAKSRFEIESLETLHYICHFV